MKEKPPAQAVYAARTSASVEAGRLTADEQVGTIGVPGVMVKLAVCVLVEQRSVTVKVTVVTPPQNGGATGAVAPVDSLGAQPPVTVTVESHVANAVLAAA